MVALDIVRASNAAIPTALPPGLVAVFIGATNGIGEETVKQFAKLAVRPKVYIVGRSQPAAENIIAECRASNPDGEYIFIQKSLDLLKNSVEVIDEIKSREKKINILFLSAGGPDMSRTGMLCKILDAWQWEILTRHSDIGR
jgi:short-subunit dehydrogenase